MIDCRYLGPGGAGRVTELLLRGLSVTRPAGRFVLWGPEEVQAHLWPSATWQPSHRNPTAAGGQAEVFRVPDGDVSLYLHQIRPFRRGPSITTIYDTIPLRHGGAAAERAAKRMYLKAAARLSSGIVTLSHYAASCIGRDLGVDEDRITVIDYPVDAELRVRVAGLRATHPPEDTVLFVGRFARHKNLVRLIEAFSHTAAAAEGARLVLVGGTPEEIRDLGGLAGGAVELRPPCSQHELEVLYATSRLLVMPSLEEGFGLPAWEAATCGLSVCLSDIPVFREILPEAPRFDPTSLEAIASAIDETIGTPPVAPEGPDAPAFATDVLDRTLSVLR